MFIFFSATESKEVKIIEVSPQQVDRFAKNFLYVFITCMYVCMMPLNVFSYQNQNKGQIIFCLLLNTLLVMVVVVRTITCISCVHLLIAYDLIFVTCLLCCITERHNVYLNCTCILQCNEQAAWYSGTPLEGHRWLTVKNPWLNGWLNQTMMMLYALEWFYCSHRRWQWWLFYNCVCAFSWLWSHCTILLKIKMLILSVCHSQCMLFLIVLLTVQGCVHVW